MEPLDFFTYADTVTKLNNWIERYEAGNPIVEDAAYDAEYKRIKQFEKEHPLMVAPDSPTLRIGANVHDGFEKVEHKIKMGSIANIYSETELTDWVTDKIDKGIDEVVLEFKIDGLAMSLPYVDSKLDDAITRGDGMTGDRVYANVLQVDTIPKNSAIPFTGEVRGEVVWFKEKFDIINEQLKSEGKKEFSNPRNGAAGSIKLKDPIEVKRRNLDFIGYRIVDGGGIKHSDDLNTLRDMGFVTSPFRVEKLTHKTIPHIVSLVWVMERERHDLPYLTDGLVVKVNDKSQYDRLGGTAKCPHAFGAYKFPSEIKNTKLISVEESPGRGGVVTPVANVEPVSLSLTTVKRSTLHNWDRLEYMGFYDGCEVIIRKAGEIIPEIIGVKGIENRSKDDYLALVDASSDRQPIIAAIAELRAKYPNIKFIQRPTVCHHCGSTLQQSTNRDDKDLVALICPNQACPINAFNTIVNFTTKSRMNMMNVGDSTVDDLYSAGFVKNISDFYRITKDQLLSIDGIKDGKADKILKGINDSRSAYLNQLICGLGIPDCGTTASVAIAEHYATLRGFVTAGSDLFSIPGIGTELGQNILDWLSVPANIEIIQYFIDNNIACKAKEKIVKGNALSGMSCIMTGKSDGIGRDEFKRIVVEQGGKIASSISAKVNLVLMGEEGAGPAKVKQIKDLQAAGNPIKVVSADEFRSIVSA